MLGPITLYTSGSTKQPKLVSHSGQDLEIHVQRAIKEIELRSYDRVLNVFPANVIANYTVTAVPAMISGAHLFTTTFDPFNYIKLFRDYQPTYTSLIPRHIELLSKTKEWKNFDMSSVRYLVTGSQTVKQWMIDALLERGVKLVANWYGMTEMPPPVFIGYNSVQFDFTPRQGYVVEFDDGECIINGMKTSDMFDIEKRIYLNRKQTANGNTWKTSP